MLPNEMLIQEMDRESFDGRLHLCSAYRSESDPDKTQFSQHFFKDFIFLSNVHTFKY